MEEVSLTIDEAKMRKMADEMLRQRCTLGDEHQYRIDQMKNFLKSDIVWESRKEILTTPLVHSCQKDPEAPALSLINQDLLYLKKGNSRPEKIVLSLYKFPETILTKSKIDVESASKAKDKVVQIVLWVVDSGCSKHMTGDLVCWSSKKQDCTAMSTAEAEYVSLSACCAQVIWMRTQLLDYGYKYNRIPMYCDSKSAIAISCNPV
ncbi:hypothetical protein Tco_1481376 [Tanacetum coccineum]